MRWLKQYIGQGNRKIFVKMQEHKTNIFDPIHASPKHRTLNGFRFWQTCHSIRKPPDSHYKSYWVWGIVQPRRESAPSNLKSQWYNLRECQGIDMAVGGSQRPLSSGNRFRLLTEMSAKQWRMDKYLKLNKLIFNDLWKSLLQHSCRNIPKPYLF